MSISADYRDRGYALLPAFLSGDICAGVVTQFMRDLREGKARPGVRQNVPLLKSNALELYSPGYPPMRGFHWGLTPAISALTGCDLVPTYAFFRMYRRDAVLRVHSDRAACEHSVSLMLAQSDGKPWPLEIATEPTEPFRMKPQDDFGDAGYSALPMAAGDAVLYRGITHRHGRMTPNPNGWSAHIFLHFVDRDGPYADQAWDGKPPDPISI